MPINLIHSNYPHSCILLALQPLLHYCLTDDSMNILNEPHLATPLSVCVACKNAKNRYLLIQT